jgi:hypothetical protein
VTLTVHESAALAGGHCWLERRLFERLGAWSPAVSAPAAKLLLDRHAQHAAWRAQQWWDRFPILAQIDRDQLVAAPTPWGTVLAEDPPGDAPGDATILAVVYRVLLPRLSARYDRHLDLTSPVADGPVIRSLGQVGADVRADWAAGERVLQDLLTDRAEVGETAAAVAAAEMHFVA